MINLIRWTGYVREVDSLGRIVLPMDTRKAFGIEPHDKLAVLLDEKNGRIILEKAPPEGTYCPSEP